MTETELLDYIRDHKGMAARLDRDYGISQAQISRWVNGKRSMCLESEIRLREAVEDIIYEQTHAALAKVQGDDNE